MFICTFKLGPLGIPLATDASTNIPLIVLQLWQNGKSWVSLMANKIRVLLVLTMSANLWLKNISYDRDIQAKSQSSLFSAAKYYTGINNEIIRLSHQTHLIIHAIFSTIFHREYFRRTNFLIDNISGTF